MKDSYRYRGASDARSTRRATCLADAHGRAAATRVSASSSRPSGCRISGVGKTNLPELALQVHTAGINLWEPANQSIHELPATYAASASSGIRVSVGLLCVLPEQHY